MQNRCKIGDLAIVVSAKLPQNVGQIVEVVGPQTGKPFALTGPGHVWQVRAVSGRDSLYYRFDKDGRVVRHVKGPVPDCRLRPVSGGTPFDHVECGTGARNGTPSHTLEAAVNESTE